MPSPVPALRARIRSSGGRLVRRLGLLPGGEPDGLGEDEALGSTVLEQRVVAFFPEPRVNGYQLEQWLRPLTALDERHGVAVVTQDSRTAAWLRGRTSLRVLCVGRTATLDGLVRRSSIGLALYVSHHPRNFSMLRYPSLAHVYVGHGESDKAVSASNQLKAYDRVFVAGPAAEERVLAQLMWFDRDRMVLIGRPQAAGTGARPGSDRPTVLYAPTWEGAQASMAYSSVLTHGVPLVRSLLAEGLRVVYRPHPRTGANRAEVRAADAALRAVFAEDTVRRGESVVDTAAPLEAAFADADVLLTDISSVAVEWLPTGRPLVVTVPADPGAVVAGSPLLEAVPRLVAAEAARAGELVRRCLTDDRERERRAELVEHYLGGADPDAALARFLDACDDVVRERDAEQARLAQAAS
ncbi:CDP-glycerol glycerophosphotransferase family protein [Blastococcus goldschmidtiae]|uniref:CDP-glycerol glycerophosphotransferase family protein n=1 Tax=Blastococcus goldschmidtiae TaxID=3075546 RepID=A0ABU2K4A6_9ACTN|nr:CDP-glycerol glycerophosphotransferase family protein [Blastococcus sp. DSM 46792]MDT0275023.1 CDP-glycerol glycerophosphotransferase family protein [Blastococcus sp. DSM 46792]